MVSYEPNLDAPPILLALELLKTVTNCTSENLYLHLLRVVIGTCCIELPLVSMCAGAGPTSPGSFQDVVTIGIASSHRVHKRLLFDCLNLLLFVRAWARNLRLVLRPRVVGANSIEICAGCSESRIAIVIEDFLEITSLLVVGR